MKKTSILQLKFLLENKEKLKIKDEVLINFMPDIYHIFLKKPQVFSSNIDFLKRNREFIDNFFKIPYKPASSNISLANFIIKNDFMELYSKEELDDLLKKTEYTILKIFFLKTIDKPKKNMDLIIKIFSILLEKSKEKTLKMFLSSRTLEADKEIKGLLYDKYLKNLDFTKLGFIYDLTFDKYKLLLDSSYIIKFFEKNKKTDSEEFIEKLNKTNKKDVIIMVSMKIKNINWKHNELLDFISKNNIKLKESEIVRLFQ